MKIRSVVLREIANDKQMDKRQVKHNLLPRGNNNNNILLYCSRI